MIALSVALGVVGLALVLAARDVALRWLAQREDARTLRTEVAAAREASLEALRGLSAELGGRLGRVEGDLAAIVDRDRQERLARMGRGR